MAEPAKNSGAKSSTGPDSVPPAKGVSLWLKLLLGVVVLIAGFLGFVAMQPKNYRVERSIKVAAPAAAVFEQVNDFHKWENWSPWAKLDPKAKAEFEGPDAGEGAIFKWDGNNEVGQGSMTILESRPPERVRIKLEFKKPFEDVATTEFVLKPEGEETLVTWSMHGENNFVGRIMCLLMNMEAMIGGQYEKGLLSIKKIVESAPKADSETAQPGS